MTPITQAEINKAAWGACDTFRGVVDPSIYKDYVLTMLFLKYLSDVWQDHLTQYQAEHTNAPELVEAMMQQEAFVLPEGASFDALHKRRHETGNGERPAIRSQRFGLTRPIIESGRYNPSTPSARLVSGVSITMIVSAVVRTKFSKFVSLLSIKLSHPLHADGFAGPV